MTAKEITGTIETIQQWKSHKGYFLHLEEFETEFYKFGRPRHSAGDEVKIQAEPGNNRFSDKMEIKKMVGKGAKGPEPLLKPKKTEPTTDEQITKYETVAKNKQAEIRRSVALKEAVRFQSLIIVPDAEPDSEGMQKEVIKIAEKFEKYLKT